MQGRAALRCTTPDYLPIVGQVPRFDAMREVFQPLAANARARIDAPGDYWPGLFVNTGHGSKGLATTPIAAAMSYLSKLKLGARRPPAPETTARATDARPQPHALRHPRANQEPGLR